MRYYAGLDVSLKETFVSVIDENGKLVCERSVASDAESLFRYLKEQGLTYERLGIESGQLSISLCKGLREPGLPAICVDARHMAAALSARVNKNDRNDARGIAQMMRAGLYKEVKVKSDECCRLKVLLGSRRQLVGSRQQMIGTIRGLLKIYGLKLGEGSASKKFVGKIRTAMSGLDETVVLSIEGLIASVEAVEASLASLNARLEKICREDEDCRLLTTVPGVGTVTAATFKSTLDDAGRFEDSETVGAYLGLTPKQYASGEVDRHGGISKAGPKECRSAMYEAAMVLLTRSKKKSRLQTWGLKIAKKKGMKKAVVATARKLSVVMHRMLADRTEFKFA